MPPPVRPSVRRLEGEPHRAAGPPNYVVAGAECRRGNPRHGAFGALTAKFGVYPRTVSRIWQRALLAPAAIGVLRGHLENGPPGGRRRATMQRSSDCEEPCPKPCSPYALLLGSTKLQLQGCTTEFMQEFFK
ncbi:hypothetical protein PHYPSEUDO_006653 [Phytophthora pseudosyringae]|uniref:Uncharacterized protein n=1 Tax=Phytophthora pseudosyringae TaxID=221518 RepID=A0A8T1WC59_9STRA|nr:hypothetical protein PHYPSEUDO_006653 [Phytophthora pseudosyringae]